MATFLVTGGCGFIGAHLVNALVGLDHDVRVLDNMSVGERHNASSAATVLAGDVRDKDTVTKAMTGVDGCFHLAATMPSEQTVGEQVGAHETNITGTINVFDSARATQRGGAVRVVYASTASVYGGGTALLSEDSLPQPVTEIGADKLTCELHARIAAETHRVPNLGLRLFSVYGPGQIARSPFSGVVETFLERVRNKQPLSIHGTGNQTRDFVYVADVVNFLIAGMQYRGRSPLVLNVCTGRPTSIKALAQEIFSIFDQESQIGYGPPRTHDITNLIGNPIRSRRELHVEATIDLTTGLQMTAGRMAV